MAHTPHTSRLLGFSFLCLSLGLGLPALADSRAPALSFSQVTVSPSVGADAVQAGLARRMRALDRCYQPALASAASLAGQVQVDFAVDGAGQVTAASLARQTWAPDVQDTATDLADCVLGVLQIVPVEGALLSDAPPAASVSVLLTPAPVVVPRKKLASKLDACVPGVHSEAARRTVLARVDIDGGKATDVKILTLADAEQGLDADAIGCLRLALQLGPHSVGVGSRYYQWQLPGLDPAAITAPITAPD